MKSALKRHRVPVGWILPEKESGGKYWLQPSFHNISKMKGLTSLNIRGRRNGDVWKYRPVAMTTMTTQATGWRDVLVTVAFGTRERLERMLRESKGGLRSPPHRAGRARGQAPAQTWKFKAKQKQNPRDFDGKTENFMRFPALQHGMMQRGRVKIWPGTSKSPTYPVRPSHKRLTAIWLLRSRREQRQWRYSAKHETSRCNFVPAWWTRCRRIAL